VLTNLEKIQLELASFVWTATLISIETLTTHVARRKRLAIVHWPGIIIYYSRPGRVWLVAGKSLTYSYSLGGLAGELLSYGQ
jgi:hypothetical protein